MCGFASRSLRALGALVEAVEHDGAADEEDGEAAVEQVVVGGGGRVEEERGEEHDDADGVESEPDEDGGVEVQGHAGPVS